MKKLYSLVAVAMFSAAAYSQTTVVYTFSGANASPITSGTIDSDVAFVTSNGSSTNTPSYYVETPTNAGGARFYGDRNTGNGNSMTLTLSGDYNITSLTFTANDTYDPAVTYKVDNGAYMPMTKSGRNYTAAITGSAKTITFKNSVMGGTANTQLRIPSLTLSYSGNIFLDVRDLNSSKANLIKNTVVSKDLFFGAKADVQILNMNGQVVKSASVTDKTVLNVSSLSKGNYIVTGIVNGQKVSQKIIKN